MDGGPQLVQHVCDPHHAGIEVVMVRSGRQEQVARAVADMLDEGSPAVAETLCGRGAEEVPRGERDIVEMANDCVPQVFMQVELVPVEDVPDVLLRTWDR